MESFDGNLGIETEDGIIFFENWMFSFIEMRLTICIIKTRDFRTLVIIQFTIIFFQMVT